MRPFQVHVTLPHNRLLISIIVVEGPNWAKLTHTWNEFSAHKLKYSKLDTELTKPSDKRRKYIIEFQMNLNWLSKSFILIASKLKYLFHLTVVSKVILMGFDVLISRSDCTHTKSQIGKSISIIYLICIKKTLYFHQILNLNWQHLINLFCLLDANVCDLCNYTK